MNIATTTIDVGVRELKNRLSHYLARVKAGEVVVVTDRGRPVARLSGLDRPQDPLAELIATGVVSPPVKPGRRRPRRRITPKGPVSDLVSEQRR